MTTDSLTKKTGPRTRITLKKSLTRHMQLHTVILVHAYVVDLLYTASTPFLGHTLPNRENSAWDSLKNALCFPLSAFRFLLGRPSPTKIAAALKDPATHQASLCGWLGACCACSHACKSAHKPNSRAVLAQNVLLSCDDSPSFTNCPITLLPLDPNANHDCVKCAPSLQICCEIQMRNS